LQRIVSRYFWFQETVIRLYKDAKKRHSEVTRRLDWLESIQTNLRRGMIAIDEVLTEGKLKPTHKSKYKDKCVWSLSISLSLVRNCRNHLKQIKPETNYAIFVKPTPIQPRLIRVGTPHVSEESEIDEDLMDYKVYLTIRSLYLIYLIDSILDTCVCVHDNARWSLSQLVSIISFPLCTHG